MRVRTARFGDIEVPEEATLWFPVGILGFPGLGRSCLLPHGGTAGLRWLQSLDDPTVAFLTVEPHLVFPDYEADVCEADVLALGIRRPQDTALLVVLTLSEDGSDVTANLLAPIVINTKTREARQVVLEGDRYQTRHPVGGGFGSVCDAGTRAKER